jgi:hypothetical protein
MTGFQKEPRRGEVLTMVPEKHIIKTLMTHSPKPKQSDSQMVPLLSLLRENRYKSSTLTTQTLTAHVDSNSIRHSQTLQPCNKEKSLVQQRHRPNYVVLPEALAPSFTPTQSQPNGLALLASRLLARLSRSSHQSHSYLC